MVRVILGFAFIILGAVVALAALSAYFDTLSPSEPTTASNVVDQTADALHNVFLDFVGMLVGAGMVAFGFYVLGFGGSSESY